MSLVGTPSDPQPLRADADVARFRRAMARFATGVTVVTARVAGVDHAMTASAFTSVSLEPLLVLVCVEREARFHDAVTESGYWGVSLLDESARTISQWLSTRGRPLHGQLDRVPHRRGPVTGVALVDPALAAIECRTTDLHPAGDHSIVVGEVMSIDLPDSPDGPLLYHRGAYTHLR
ncbi:flavin reductase family protein [Angustibacter luteus]|uniref:Flavin reductase family protein n=1 Tax=Angustibacter luteus TaxID=658456 RepID=A0ABW1JJB7_9ACTN